MLVYYLETLKARWFSWSRGALTNIRKLYIYLKFRRGKNIKHVFRTFSFQAKVKDFWNSNLNKQNLLWPINIPIMFLRHSFSNLKKKMSFLGSHLDHMKSDYFHNIYNAISFSEFLDQFIRTCVSLNNTSLLLMFKRHLPKIK